MATTVNKSFTYLEANQFNPEITINASLDKLDILVSASIINTLTTPPTGANGDAYIVGTGGTGAWAGKDKYIAYYYNGWNFVIPRVGLFIYYQPSNSLKVYNGALWVELTTASEYISSTFRIIDNIDSTKKVSFNTTSIPTGTVISLTVPNSNYVLQKQNLSATAMPTSSDDSADGYSLGSLWINTTTDKAYICVDSTAGASVWKEVASATGAGDVLGPVSSLVNEITRWTDTTGDNIKGSSVYLTDNKELYPYHKVVDEKTLAYTLVPSDSGKVIIINSSSNLVVTLPQTSTAVIANGFHCRVIRRGTGTVTFAIQGTDTIESRSNFVTISSRYGEVEVTKIVNGTPNTWHLSGDLA